jgi:hypothetical protein
MTFFTCCANRLARATKYSVGMSSEMREREGNDGVSGARRGRTFSIAQSVSVGIATGCGLDDRA